MIQRETSYRRVKAILGRPEVAEYLGTHESVPIGGNVLYLRTGAGLMLYVLCGDHAYVHAALVAGTLKQHVAEILEQFRHVFALGAKRIIARIRKDNIRAQKGALSIGFVPRGDYRGCFVYEVTP